MEQSCSGPEGARVNQRDHSRMSPKGCPEVWKWLRLGFPGLPNIGQISLSWPLPTKMPKLVLLDHVHLVHPLGSLYFSDWLLVRDT
jgi:hypothetical protein